MEIKRLNSGWLIAVGIIFLIIGLLAIVTPIATSISLGWLMGVLLIVSGLVQFVHARRAEQAFEARDRERAA